MNGAAVVTNVDDLLERLDTFLDEFATVELTGLADAELLGLVTGVEQRVRRLATVDHALVAETDTRGLALQHGCSEPPRSVRRPGLLAQPVGLSRFFAA